MGPGGERSEHQARVSAVAVKSRAQRRKFAELLVDGKIKPEVYERWNRDAGRKKLPERVKRKKSRKKKGKRKK